MTGFWGEAWAFVLDNLSGDGGIPELLVDHIRISVFTVVLASVIALPGAMWLGHRGKGLAAAVAVVNIGRAIPSFAIVALALPVTIAIGLGLGFWPTFLALFALALPPIFVNTVTGVSEVDDSLVESARGMGLTEGQILRSIELPVALPVILSGVRLSAVQVVATATLGALVGWGGLGRYVVDGFATQNNPKVFIGGLLVALLAIATEVFFSLIERVLIPKGLRRRSSNEPSHEVLEAH